MTTSHHQHPNPVIFQTFEWNLPPDNKHYIRLLHALPKLSSFGITALWLPPACKAGNSSGNGYDIYDLYDLGEFDQRGSRPTKWGTKEDLMALVAKAQQLGVDLYFDAVLNHRCGGDARDVVSAVEVDPEDRNAHLCHEREVETWVQFSFEGRRGKYSDVKYNWRMFNATDWDDRTQKRGIFKFVSGEKCWASDVSDEWGNGDYLMFNNLDYTNSELRKDTKDWGVWVTEHLGLAGFRLDAMQHFSQRFSTDWIGHVRKHAGRSVFVVGEYWNGNVETLTKFLCGSPPDLHLYDAPLLYNFGRLSHAKNPDLRSIFHRTLVNERPENAVTLVMNHDTQKGQVMDTPIHSSFTSLAYSFILFRQAGYPCVFYGDMYGICDPFPSPSTCGGKLADLILARKLYAYGEQVDYFQRPDCIGWVRRGLSESSGPCSAGMAVVMSWVGEHSRVSQNQVATGPKSAWLNRLFSQSKSSSPAAQHFQRTMDVGKQHAGEVWTDILGQSSQKVTISRGGMGCFPCNRNTVAIYVSHCAEGRDRFPVRYDPGLFSSS